MSTAVQNFAASISGQVITPDSPDYDEARTLWNGMFDQRPALIVRCANTSDVVACVNHARKQGLQVAVRGGGHNAAGHATCEGGLVIDLSAMRAVTVDPERRTAHAQGGATWADVDQATGAHGLATTGGGVSTTGIGGLTLGGGLGWLMRSYGLTCDNLRSAEVVTADGRVLTASATSHPDLFWGLRGGGGNFGVVTSFEYQLHPVGLVLGGLLAYPAPRTAEILRHYRALMATAPDALTIFAGLMTTPEGIPVIGLLVCHNGPAEEGMALIQPLLDLGPVMQQVAPMPYTVLQTLQDAIFPHGLNVYWRSHFLPRLSDAAIDTIADAFATVSSPLSVVLIECLGGAVGRVGANDTAFAHRDADYNIAILGRWADPAGADEHIAWTRRFHDALAPHASGVYVNYLGEEGQDRIASAYSPEQYRRLVALKDAYDPTNFFRRNQNIRPSGPGGNGPTSRTPNSGTTSTNPTPVAPVLASSLRATLRADLDTARTLFLDTLALVGDDHWRDRSVGSRWRLGEVLAHIASYLDAVIPMALANARQGKSMPNMPAFLLNQMN